MKKTNKNKRAKKEVERVKKTHQPVFSTTVVQTPSREVIEEATGYVEDRFSRALVRLSDR